MKPVLVTITKIQFYTSFQSLVKTDCFTFFKKALLRFDQEFRNLGRSYCVLTSLLYHTRFVDLISYALLGK